MHFLTCLWDVSVSSLQSNNSGYLTRDWKVSCSSGETASLSVCIVPNCYAQGSCNREPGFQDVIGLGREAGQVLSQSLSLLSPVVSSVSLTLSCASLKLAQRASSSWNGIIHYHYHCCASSTTGMRVCQDVVCGAKVR